MNIINKKLDEVNISELSMGDVFREGDCVYMVTGSPMSLGEDIEGDAVWCVDLQTGRLLQKPISRKVTICRNAEIWI